MDHEATPASGTYHLYGVRKTLRRLYLPDQAPNKTIDEALAALARVEREVQERHRVRLAPAA